MRLIIRGSGKELWWQEEEYGEYTYKTFYKIQKVKVFYKDKLIWISNWL